MRAMANDREITATSACRLGVEAGTWFGCGILAGIAGLLLADLFGSRHHLTFLVFSSLAAALIARLRSIAVTFVAAIVIGVLHDMLTPINSLTNYRDLTPFVLAVIGLLELYRHRVIALPRGGIVRGVTQRRPAGAGDPPGRHPLRRPKLVKPPSPPRFCSSCCSGCPS